MTTAVAENIRSHLARQASAAETAYKQLVADSHAGADIDPGRAAEVLADAGKSPSDLEADCEKLDDLARLEKIADEHEFQTARSDLRSLQKSEASALKAFQAARETWKLAQLAYDQATAGHATLREETEGRLRSIATARGELSRRVGRTFPPAPADESLAVLRQHLRDATSRRGAAVRPIADLRVYVEAARSNWELAKRAGGKSATETSRKHLDDREEQLAAALTAWERCVAEERALSDKILLLTCQLGV